MDRGIPTSSKVIAKKINDRNRQIHLLKLKTIQSSVNCKAPPSYSHLKKDGKKKNKFEDERNLEIEKENKALLSKLTSIMEGTGISSNKGAAARSLNYDLRKRDLVKITIENEAFLRRLQDQKSTYKLNDWETDYKKSKLYLQNICEYPPAMATTAKASNKTETNGFFNKHDVSTSHNSTRAGRSLPPNKFNQTLAKLTPIKKPHTEKLQPIHEPDNKQLLYSAKKKIGFATYLLHIYFHNNQFNIVASNNERCDFKTFSISRKEGEELIARFQGNFEEITNQIKFNGPKIIIESLEDAGDMGDIAEVSADKEQLQGLTSAEESARGPKKEDKNNEAENLAVKEEDEVHEKSQEKEENVEVEVEKKNEEEKFVQNEDKEEELAQNEEKQDQEAKQDEAEGHLHPIDSERKTEVRESASPVKEEIRESASPMKEEVEDMLEDNDNEVQSVEY